MENRTEKYRRNAGRSRRRTSAGNRGQTYRKRYPRRSRMGKRQRQKRVRMYRMLVGAVILLLLAAAVLSMLRRRTEQDGITYQLSEACESYRPQVETVAAQYGMSEYVDLIMAVMMQESSGQGIDVMQASEGGFNEKYPREPNGIKDTDYSIACGIQELKSALEKAEVTGPDDLQRIEQALQAYNFGLVYLDYAQENGADSWNEETVSAFAEMASGGKTRDEAETEAMGKWKYGDQMYPKHVLRYYPPYTEMQGTEE